MLYQENEDVPESVQVGKSEGWPDLAIEPVVDPANDGHDPEDDGSTAKWRHPAINKFLLRKPTLDKLSHICYIEMEKPFTK